MKAHTVSLINAATLILCSLWGYLSPSAGSLTALIPAAFGIALILCYQGVKAQNKIIAHIAVLLTLVVLVALIVPLRGALARGDDLAILRVTLMLATSALAVVYFVKSFIDARRSRA
ncbi:MAG: hypothetical protein AAGC92_02085 [Pseudomonadota bacterium]